MIQTRSLHLAVHIRATDDLAGAASASSIQERTAPEPFTKDELVSPASPVPRQIAGAERFLLDC
ncbi:hypothetical protein PYH37_002270 [Sinorhizobium numidicum]|uniref:Uncharacterized protein n=1 Tax=Sinorhizobium numidicum TaxID=680248 RepID=A0ABY8CZR7_9HYPH|nr:hypothetical protein [Sinorhizobium numidicum]WEX77474.1 hypothetical protein PYH37_002270 [Sinorhizobium numidicum]WEX84134.1 hypothetical protein PYH38_002983 [Sinorhizobium numidicum]